MKRGGRYLELIFHLCIGTMFPFFYSTGNTAVSLKIIPNGLQVVKPHIFIIHMLILSRP